MIHTLPPRGFTFIELLVVISIIALLSSVVLSALQSARLKAADAAIKANLANARPEAELFFSNQNPTTYDAVCAPSGTNTIGDNIAAAERAYRGAVSTYADGTASTWNTAQCHDSPTQWAAWVPLKSSTSVSPRGFCVDHAGAAIINTILDVNITKCP